MGLVYYITIPSMYLFLVIYSFFNLNVVSWGTREVAEKKSAAQMAAEQADAEEDAKKKATKTKSSFLGINWLIFTSIEMYIYTGFVYSILILLTF